MISGVIELMVSLGWNPMRLGYSIRRTFRMVILLTLIYKGGGWVDEEDSGEMGDKEGHGGLMELFIIRDAYFDDCQMNGGGGFAFYNGMGMI